MTDIIELLQIEKYRCEEVALSTEYESSTYEKTAKIFKAFCDENRLKILELLKSGEKCGCTLQEELPICQSTLSHHMKILVESGIVEVRKDHKWSYYSLSSNGSQVAIAKLNDLLTKNYDELKFCSCDAEAING